MHIVALHCLCAQTRPLSFTKQMQHMQWTIIVLKCCPIACNTWGLLWMTQLSFFEWCHLSRRHAFRFWSVFQGDCGLFRHRLHCWTKLTTAWCLRRSIQKTLNDPLIKSHFNFNPVQNLWCWHVFQQHTAKALHCSLMHSAWFGNSNLPTSPNDDPTPPLSLDVLHLATMIQLLIIKKKLYNKGIIEPARESCLHKPWHRLFSKNIAFFLCHTAACPPQTVISHHQRW